MAMGAIRSCIRKYMDELDAAVQAKLDGDTDFQSSLTGLSDEEKAPKIEARRKEVLGDLWKEAEDARKKAEKIAQDQRGRAEKAESEAKKALPRETKRDLSNKDIVYLAKADIHEDDIDEVLEYAQFKNVSVQEAHKKFKPLLDVRVEERKSAAAANVKPTARTSQKTSPDTIIEKARKGELSDKDEDIQSLIDAEWAAKKAKAGVK